MEIFVCCSCALLRLFLFDMGVRAGLGEELEGGEGWEGWIGGVDVFGSRPGGEFALEEGVEMGGGKALTPALSLREREEEEVLGGLVEVVEAVEEAEVGWGVLDWVFGHAC